MNSNRFKIFISTTTAIIFVFITILVCSATNSFAIRCTVAVLETITMFYLIFIWQD